MNSEEKQLVKKYLKYRRKVKMYILIIICIFILPIILCILFRYNNTTIYYGGVEEKTAPSENKIEIDINIEDKEETEDKLEIKENNVEITKEEEPTNITESYDDKTVEEDYSKVKPRNKEFLFIEGYTMENVSSAAEQYLINSGYNGECIPIQDEEGIFLGMKVIFY